jgi:hypothetical protein
MSSSPRLLRDLIHIPESVHQGDLVFQLVDAADDAARTVAEYVVTEQLRTAFLEAVGLLGSAVTDGSSKAAYLHGSFGSGKSNFMGMLQLLLDDNTAARAVPELAPVVEKLDGWKGNRRFLTVPFHLIGESDLESAVFGQYVRYLEHHEPGAPPPAVFADEPILENADDLRASVGDEAFFAKLSEGSGGGGGSWGDLGAGWDAVSYESARNAAHGTSDRIRLVQAVLTTWLTSFADAAHANKGGYVSFEDGLSAISHHAKSLGYDGVILFLDELILWFLSRLADTAWVSEEASKLSELVEAASSGRPVPIVSIIARQRDLRELVGDSVPGAEKLSFADQLDYQQGRFSTIKLDDSNLPVVANRRLLKPINDDAATELAEAFKHLSLSQRVRDALLAEDGTDEAFRLTYPFSPAFMTVLVDVAGALQRTRTGLRVLLDLLVARRDHLEVGQLVPVGDLYDVIDGSDEPFSDAMKSAFEQARKIYKERLRPTLLAEHHLDTHDAATVAFTNDDRLVKTLLLAALVPQSVPFKSLTVEGLVALNHGTISSPVPGQETAIATNKLRRLAAHAGELRLGTDPNNPTVSIVLADVDTSAILNTASGIDNTANRRTLVRELVQSALALPGGQLQSTYTLLWKGLPRHVTVVFGNLRDTAELPDSTFANNGPEWKLLIDFPFDEPGHTPLEDLERLDRFAQNSQSWNTLCWLPAFFTAPTLDILGRLVRLNHVLASDQRFNEATATLSPTARASAKPQLEAMQSAARSQLEAALLVAYGVVGADEKVVDRSHSLASHFPSLKAGLAIAPPAKANLKDSLDQVLDQALRHTYPGAPDLQSEVKPADVRKVEQLSADAVVEDQGRLVVNDVADRRLLARVANPLELGVQSEQAFKLAETAERWDNTFTKAINTARQNGTTTPTVGLLRESINAIPMGLTTQIENLIILVWARTSSRSFSHHGGPVSPSVDRLDDDWAVEERPLPSLADWEKAHERLPLIFGPTLRSRSLSAFAVEQAGIALTEAVADHHVAADGLVTKLRQRSAQLGMDADFQRLRTAEAAQALLSELAAASDDLAKVQTLARAQLPTSELALSKSLATAAALGSELDAAQFDIMTAAFGFPEGEAPREELIGRLSLDEFNEPLVPVLHAVQAKALSIITARGPKGPKGPKVGTREWTGRNVGEARAKLDELAAAGTDEVVEISIRWTEPGQPESAG